MRNRLQVEKSVCPGRGSSEPDEGDEGRQDEVDLWVALLLVRVESGVEEVEGEAVIVTKSEIAPGEFFR